MNLEKKKEKKEKKTIKISTLLNKPENEPLLIQPRQFQQIQNPGLHGHRHHHVHRVGVCRRGRCAVELDHSRESARHAGDRCGRIYRLRCDLCGHHPLPDPSDG